MKNILKKAVSLLGYLVIPAILICAYVGFAVWARAHWGNWQISGVFGDTFGAFNALVATLALAASLYTLFAQVRQSRIAEENEKLRVQPIVIPRLQQVGILRPETATMPDGEAWMVLPIVVETDICNVSDIPAFNLKIDVYLQNNQGDIILGVGSRSAHPYALGKDCLSSRHKLNTNSIKRNFRNT